MNALRSALAAVMLLAAPFATAATMFTLVMPATARTGTPFTFKVTAMNDSAVDTGYTGTVHFTSSDGGAVLPADYTFTSADQGVHTFTATLATADKGAGVKPQSITSTDVVESWVKGAGSTDVMWAEHLVRALHVTAPEVVEKNTPFQITVQALNTHHMPVTQYDGTIQITADYNAGTFPSAYTFTPADHGAHTFTVTLNRPGELGVSAYQMDDSWISGRRTVNVVCPDSELTVTAGNNGPVCPGTFTGTLWATSNPSGLTYHWRRAGSLSWARTSTESIPEVGAGTYIVTVTLPNGCTATSQTVIEEFPAVAPAATMPASSCGNVHAEITNASEFASIEWFVIHGAIVSGQGTSEIEVHPDSDSFTAGLWIRAEAVTPNGCRTELSVRRVDVSPGVDANITTAANACPNTSLEASVPDSGPATYNWFISNGTITNGQGTRAIHYTPAGNGDVTLNVNVTKGSCSASDTQAVAIDGPTAFLNEELHICAGGEATIPVVLSGTAPFTIVWSDGVQQSGINTTNVSRSVSPDASTSYSIVSVSDANCTGTAQGSALVLVDAAAAIAKDPKNVSIKSGEKATLTVDATGAQFDWYRGNAGDRRNLVASGSSRSFTTPALTATTSYWVEVLSACGNVQSKTATVTIAGGKQRAVRR